MLRIGSVVVRMLAHRHLRHLNEAVRVDHRASFGVAMARGRRQKHVLLTGHAAAWGVRLLGHRRLALIDKLELVVGSCALKESLLRPGLLDAVPTGRKINLVLVGREVALAVIYKHVLVVRTHVLE